jgi:hypothetical protein
LGNQIESYQRQLIMKTAIRLALIGAVLSVCSAVQALTIVDPDAFAAGTVLNNAFSGVTLAAYGDAGVLLNANVISATDSYAPTGSRVFADTSSSPNYWGDGSYSYLRADFASGATQVWLDFAANDDSDNNPFLRAYDSSGTLVASATAGYVSLGSPITLTVSASSIAYITASWDEVNKIDNGILDNLRYESAASVPEVISTWMPFGLTVCGLAIAARRRQCR